MAEITLGHSICTYSRSNTLGIELETIGMDDYG